MQPEGRGPNLVILIIIGLATFLLPIVQRWLKQRAERSGGPPREESDPQDVFDPFQGLRREESEETEPLEDEEVLEVPKRTEVHSPAAPAEVKPLLLPAASVPARPRDVLETRLFGSRRWSSGAKLVIAKELLGKPGCFRRRI